MQVTVKELNELMGRTFEAAQGSPCELRDQVIEELFADFLSRQEKPWVKLKFNEWKALPTGKRIFHSLFGEGTVGLKAGEKFVSFRGFRLEIMEDGWPWDQSVQLL